MFCYWILSEFEAPRFWFKTGKCVNWVWFSRVDHARSTTYILPNSFVFTGMALLFCFSLKFFLFFPFTKNNNTISNLSIQLMCRQLIESHLKTPEMDDFIDLMFDLILLFYQMIDFINNVIRSNPVDFVKYYWLHAIYFDIGVWRGTKQNKDQCKSTKLCRAFRIFIFLISKNIFPAVIEFRKQNSPIQRAIIKVLSFGR